MKTLKKFGMPGYLPALLPNKLLSSSKMTTINITRAFKLSDRWLVASFCAVLFGVFFFTIMSCSESSRPENEQDERILWSFLAEANTYYGSPALSLDEQTVYIGTSDGILASPATNNALYALFASSGKLQWKYPLGSKEVRSTPAIAQDGSIVFVASEHGLTGTGGRNDYLYKLSSAGQLIWTYNINPSPGDPVDIGQSAPAIAPDGTIYVAAGGLYAIDPEGQHKWTRFYPAVEDLRNSPIIDANGIVYFVYHNIPLTAIDPSDGHTLWSLNLGVNDHVLASPALGADGTIFIATYPGVVYAVSATGSLLWTFDANSIGYTCWMKSSPAIDSDGTIYLGTNSLSSASVFFLALDHKGALKWLFEPSDLPADVPSSHFDIYSSPAIGSDGAIYFGMEFGRVYALKPEDGSQLWMVETENAITWSSPALSALGTLFISDLSGHTYAIRTESSGLKAQAPWPKFRHDNQNTGLRIN